MVSENRLDNKIAMVSGASKGIGAAIAIRLAGAGATVVVNYATSKSGADKVVAEIEAAGGKAFALQGDFSKPGDIARVYAEIGSRYGRIDVLVNNAGIFRFAPIEDVTPENFHDHFDLNVMGLLLSIKAAVPLFGADGGSIINVGSTVGRMAQPNSVVYCATKGAVDTITVALSKELGARKIRVNSVNPGFVRTEGTIEGGIADGEFAEVVLKGTPLGRVGQPDDIAKVAVFLASNESGWVNGQHIDVAGGHTM
ncbi:MAG: SDR family NAD(P)-dependent oxidoreductase [Janthinobacterium lividum]